MKRFDEFKFLFPARPASAILPQQMDYFEEKGFVSQKKKNGICTIAGFGPNGEVELWNRHKEKLSWFMPSEVRNVLRPMGGTDSWKVVVGELLHSKVGGGPRDTLYLFDVLVWKGEYLLGVPYDRRMRLLHDDAYRPPTHELVLDSHIAIHPKVWLALSFMGASRKFAEIKPGGVDEGIVMKNPAAPLQECDRESANSQTMVKVRYATKNYSHHQLFDSDVLHLKPVGQ